MLLAGIRDRVWASSLLAFASYIARLCVLTKGDEPRMAQVMIGCPFGEGELADQSGLQPQCRMPDYAASGVASIGITAFSVILFRHNQAGMRQRNRAPFAHVSKRCATNLGPSV